MSKKDMSPTERQYKYCLRCGKRLISDTAKQLGMGKVCWEKYQSTQGKKHILFK